MIDQLTVLIIISAVLYAGTSLRHLALAGDCEDCNCGGDERLHKSCCDEESKKGSQN